ncbi:MAG TPA: hydrogenase nickel incorporation protein HypB [Candidatus Latescibacteria bacterium]|nr:hydrogenase nickel incorporation protein HypB [Candidatus Latescibacterota bacterium]
MAQIKVLKDVLEVSQAVADQTRSLLGEKKVFMINIMGSPGSGKTSLLERTLPFFSDLRVGLIEGDIRTMRDAQKLSGFDLQIVQINTEPFGGDCHLPPNLIASALRKLDLDGLDLIFVENVGNLVCPAEFDIGEDLKVVVLSLPEGEDKPLKYPLMFRVSQACVVSKVDLQPYLWMDVETVRENILSVNPAIPVFPLSARTGEGVEAWCRWLRERMQM